MNGNIKEVKSVLAKLLATENLTVEFADVETASFDVKNRVLLIPQLKDLKQEVLDLFVGHEVAHALWTPLDGVENLPNKSKNFHTFINVVEDARIERFIQKRYPGLKKAFYAGYQELKNADFFNLKDTNVNDLLLIDRINLKAKLGTQIDIEFTDAVEQDFFDRSMQTVTFDDVVELAEELFAYCEKEMEEKQEQQVQAMQDYQVGDSADQQGEETDENQEDGQEVEVPTQTQTNETAEEEEEETDDASETEGSDSQADETEESLKEETTQGEKQSELNDYEDEKASDVDGYAPGPVSLTDIAKDSNETELYETDESKITKYIDIPKDINLDKIIIPFNKIKTDCYQYWNVLESARRMEMMTKLAKDFKKNNEKVINYLHKEFEMKKAADRYARASQSKTGVINTNKLFSYKYNDDLFLKKTVLPNGKDHGMVFFLDWSGSMAENLKGTMEQLLCLALFCRKANVPFSAYAFSSETHKYESLSLKDIQSTNNHEANIHELRLLEIFNEKMTNTEFNKSLEIWLAISTMFGRGSEMGYWGLPRAYYLSGTPLDSTIVVAHRLVADFQKRNNVQIMNTVFLTDGCSHKIDGTIEYRGGYMDYSNGRAIYSPSTKVIRDKSNHSEVKVDSDMTTALYQSLKHSTGSNTVGFFVASNRDLRYAFSHYFRDSKTGDYDSQLKEFRSKINKEKAVATTKSGLDELYIIKGGKNLEVNDEGLQVDENATKGQLTTAFKKMTKGKLQNRVILSKFIDRVAA